MTARTLLLAMLMLVGPAARAFEAHLAAGLAVSIDRIAEPVSVDGVSMQLQRLTGVDVPVLARRVEALWRSQGSQIRSLQQGAWTLRSRMLGTKVEVLQWRSSAGAPEMLWSLLETGALQPVPQTDLVLPAHCKWGRSVSGQAGQRHYLQRSARCALPIGELSAQLRHMLPLQGWKVRSASDGGLLLDRQGDEGMIFLSEPADDLTTWLVWLHVRDSR